MLYFVVVCFSATITSGRESRRKRMKYEIGFSSARAFDSKGNYSLFYFIILKRLVVAEIRIYSFIFGI